MIERSSRARRLAPVIAICVVAWMATTRGQQPVRPPAAEYVAGEILVKFRPGSSSARRNNVLYVHAARVLRKYNTIDVHRIGLPSGQSVAAAVAAFRADPDVLAVQPNYIRHVATAGPPNDPYWIDPSNQMWGLVKIMAQPTWNNFGGGDGTVVVAD